MCASARGVVLSLTFRLRGTAAAWSASRRFVARPPHLADGDLMHVLPAHADPPGDGLLGKPESLGLRRDGIAPY
jgi:hypothetical protein